MEKREPYAHGRVLSIKRMLVKAGPDPEPQKRQHREPEKLRQEHGSKTLSQHWHY